MNIGVDIDGTIHQTHIPWICLLNEKFSKYYDEYDLTNWNKIIELYGEGCFEVLEKVPYDYIYPEVLNVVYELARRNKIYFISGVSSSAMAEKKFEFLTNMFKFNWCFILSKNQEDKFYPFLDILIDDNEDVVRNHVGCVDNIILLKRPWNRNVDGVKVVRNWEEIGDMLCGK